MQTPYFGNAANVTPTASAFYCHLFHPSAFSSSESLRSDIISVSGIIYGIYIMQSTAPGAGTSVTYTVRVNGIDTGMTLTIADTNISGYSSGTATVSAGDTISLSLIGTNTPGATGSVQWNVLFNAATFGESQFIATTTSAFTASTTNYLIPSGEAAVGLSTESQALAPCPVAGTVSNLYLQASGSVGTTCTATLYVNGSPSLLTATITFPLLISNNTVNSISVNAGDSLSWRVDQGTGTPRLRLSARFVSSTPGFSCLFDSGASFSSNPTVYQSTGQGNSTLSATENTKLHRTGYTLSMSNLAFIANPASGEAATTTLRVNQASSSLTTSITGPATANRDTTDIVSITPTQTIGIQFTRISGSLTPAIGVAVTSSSASQTLTLLGVGS